MDWDQLRFFLELARAGRLVIAARRLEVDHTTVSRKVQALEKKLGMTLFLREPDGYKLTEAGRDLLPQVEAMESAYVGIAQSLTPGSDQQLSGLVRVGATEGYGSTILASQLTRLSQRHPDLKVELLAVPRALQLSRNEADIVITLERPERGPFIITRLTDYSLRLYASHGYLAQHSPIHQREQLKGHSFVSYVDDLLYSKELLFLDEVVKPARTPLRSTSILAQQQMVAAGAGLAILPAFAADQNRALVPVLPDAIHFTRTFWMLMPIELKDIARMRTTWNFLREQAAQLQSTLLPEHG
ncbi:LysR family transcriptional regulator [Thiopseudomonas denitrificans]|uniref:LysR family transcriptional regulator n=1 Tax=Thiopseudomonas denitrificans TaxID=1501432 RepID=A0A4R6TWM2_9GAMM|nr:LysR family transcriptional regulator [Thiopseudomonas denitrificans]TDQ37871.1 LysR family transcriptional regulator [Thiopseudomonas denitrificans]